MEIWEEGCKMESGDESSQVKNDEDGHKMEGGRKVVR